MRSTQRLHDDYDALIIAEDLDRRRKCYHFFSSIDEFLAYQPQLSSHLYEVIVDRQRLYFDLDSSVELDLSPLLALLVQPRVYTSHRPGKYSYHVIDSRYVNDNVQCKYQVQLIKAQLPDPLASAIDLEVYRNFQLFRLLGSSKYGLDNVKVGPGTLRESLVTNIDGCQLIDDCPIPYPPNDLRYQQRQLAKLLNVDWSNVPTTLRDPTGVSNQDH